MRVQIHPVSGPLEGGTKLTVVGINLGVASVDTEVSIGGLPCRSVDYISPTTRYLLLSVLLPFLTVLFMLLAG